MTRAVRQRMFPDSPVNCPLCAGGPEDCSHLFFHCLLAQEVWREAAVVHLFVTSDEAFWSSLSGGFFRREAYWRRIFASVGNLDPQKRSHLQGRHPTWRWHYTHRRGVLSFLALRWRMPVERCTPATIDFVIILFH